jgi:hypothetical protein
MSEFTATAHELARPRLVRQTAIHIPPCRYEHETQEDTTRRSTRFVKRPSRLLDELMLDSGVQEFWYQFDPPDVEEAELSHYSDDEWIQQVEEDAYEEATTDRLSDLDGFIVDDIDTDDEDPEYRESDPEHGDVDDSASV